MVSIPIAKPLIGEAEKAAVMAVLDSGILAQGPRVAEFEQAFADYCGAKYGVATSNGTTALHLTLLAAGVRPGDEVITTPFSFFATGSTIVMCGAAPVFADIDAGTFNLAPEAVKGALSEKTRAVLPVHLFGQPCDMDPLRELCEEKGVTLIEDACQAHGAEYKGRRTGSLGDLGAFSFYPTKNMTCGEGGLVTTDNEELAEQVRLLRAHGQSSRYRHAAMGFNFRLTDIAAAIGLVQLGRLDEFTRRRQANAAALDRGLAGVSQVSTPIPAPERTHVYHQYTLRVEEREGLTQKLQQAGIGFGIHYPKLIYQSRALADFAANCPVAEKAVQEVISLPVHPSVSGDNLKKIIAVVIDFYKK